MIRIPFTDDANATAILAQQVALGYKLLDEQRLFEDNFLVFESASAIEEKTDMEEIGLKIAKALFQHENRIRTLEGKAPITKVQFIAALKAL